MILWLIVLGLMGLLIGSAIMSQKSYFDGLWFTLGSIAVLVLFTLFFAWICNYTVTIGRVESFKATQATLETLREKEIDPLERVALQQKIIDQNQWLARAQYWNSTIFNPMYPNEIDELKPLR